MNCFKIYFVLKMYDVNQVVGVSENFEIFGFTVSLTCGIIIKIFLLFI